MKALQTILIMAGMLIPASHLSAQDNANDDCVVNNSLYFEYFKQDNYIDAMPFWRYMFNNCPHYSKNIYIHGVKLYSDLAEQNKDDKELVKAYVDSIILVYDQRVQNYQDSSKVKGLKGMDILRIRKAAGAQQAYQLLKESVQEEGAQTEVYFPYYYMQSAFILYKYLKKLEAGDMVGVFGQVNKVYDQMAKQGTAKPKQIKKYKKMSKDLFIQCDPSCEDLEPYYKKKWEAEPENLELMAEIAKVLADQECEKTELFYKVSIELDKRDPSAGSAYNIAKMSKSREDYAKAEEYYKLAIERTPETDTILGKYYLELADVQENLGKYGAARSSALKSLEYEKNGNAYLLIGMMYGKSAGACSEDEFEKKCVYIAAVNKFVQAKQIDPSVADKANQLISRYNILPDTEEGFFRNLQPGDPYTIGCWIGETIQIRYE